jgi:hypothetical protein
MISSKDIPSSGYYTKNLVSDQTYRGVNKKLNTTMAFDATKGLGIEGSTSSTAILASAGGVKDCRVTANMIRGTSESGTPSMQVCARVTTWDLSTAGTTADQDWYCARVQSGQGRLTKVVAGSYTNIASAAFSWSIGDELQISLTCVGTELVATFENVTAAPGTVITVTGSDSSITAAGAIGFRTLTASMWLKSFTVEHL